jgi:hypothetical protein
MSRVHQPTGAVRRILTSGVVVLALAASAAACVGGGASDAGSDRPTPPAATPAAPVGSPAAPASPSSTPPAASKPPAAPSEEPGRDAMPITVELETVDHHDVRVDIVDRTGSLTTAVSGTPAEGMSADGLEIRNVDADTLRLTWVDFGIDNALALFVDEVDGKLRMVLVQPPPKAPTDAMGFDRVLLVSFDSPVAARDVEAILQDGLDTPG